jgi:alpha-N-acetylglucosamine transferase
MLVLQNMDELMDIPLDDPDSSSLSSSQTPSRVFAASHVCACNPLRKPHYPKTWIPENCAFTSQHANPDVAQLQGADPSKCVVAMMNGGLAVLRPSKKLYKQIVDRINSHGEKMYFPDQEVLSDLFRGRWVALPYVYNALKTMRKEGVHAQIWRDESVKNVHYILSPKPWEEVDEMGTWVGTDETHRWWFEANQRRKRDERAKGVEDGY